MTLVRYFPLREMERCEDRINRIFGDALPSYWAGRTEQKAWEPAVDIYEADKEFVLKVELPEFEKKDVQVNMEGNILTISGERKAEKEVKEENFHRRERYYGSFTRSFVLPESVDREGIKATFKDGVMKLELPKKEEVKPRQIKIEAA